MQLYSYYYHVNYHWSAIFQLGRSASGIGGFDSTCPIRIPEMEEGQPLGILYMSTQSQWM